MKRVTRLIVILCLPIAALAQQPPCERTYTSDADFDEGVLFNVNHTAPGSGQLQLDPPRPVNALFPYIWVACSDRGTVVRIDVNTGRVLGEYKTAPSGRHTNPSRTTVDLDGNVWVSNRAEGDFLGSYPSGSVVKIGLVIGGTRTNQAGQPDPNGRYLKPPFTYSTAVDRNNDGLICTSAGLLDTLSWLNNTDAEGGFNALVEDAEDECILIYQRLPNAPNPRHCSVDNDNHIWVGGYPNLPTALLRYWFHKLDNATGAILQSFDAQRLHQGGPGGYGGLIDREGIIWSTNPAQGTLMRYDPDADTGVAMAVPGSYGVAMDPANGDIWNTGATDVITKMDSKGRVYAGFPKPTHGRTPKGVVVAGDGNVWLANNTTGTVVRLDNNGEERATIDVDSLPTGVAVDANGRIWVTNYASDNVMRIDPNAGPRSLGAIDMTIDLGAGSGPYNYSDMTGAHSAVVADWTGEWVITQQSCNKDSKWGRISWTADVPAGTELGVFARGTGNTGWKDITAKNGLSLCRTIDELYGDSLQVRVTFKGDTTLKIGPILYDLTIEQCPAGDPVSCSLAGETALGVEGYGYSPNPFYAGMTVRNTGISTVDSIVARIQLPGYITTADPPVQGLPRLDPGMSAGHSWLLTAKTSAFDRQARIVVTVRDGTGTLLTTCEHYIFIPGIIGLACSTSEDITLYYDESLMDYVPNPFMVVSSPSNELDTALTNVEIEVSFSPPGIIIENPPIPIVKIGVFPAHDTLHFTWTLGAGLVDTTTVVTATFTVRSDQYPDGRTCSFKVTVPPRRITYCVDCRQRGVDTVWINSTNEIILPNPFQAAIAVSNPCSGELTNVECTISLPAGIDLVPGEAATKTIDHLAHQETRYVMWDLITQPSATDITVSIPFTITSPELQSPEQCRQTTYIVHSANIPSAISKKLLYFRAVRFGAVPPVQEVTVYAGYPAELPWTAVYPGWLVVQPESGNSLATVSVEPLNTAFPLGRYEGSVDVQSMHPNSPATVDVVYDLVATVGIADKPSVAPGITLHQNYPNPFSSSTIVSYSAEVAQHVAISVFNLLGRQVRIMELEAEAGTNSVQISGLPPGVYSILIRGKSGTAGRMMLCR